MYPRSAWHSGTDASTPPSPTQRFRDCQARGGGRKPIPPPHQRVERGISPGGTSTVLNVTSLRQPDELDLVDALSAAPELSPTAAPEPSPTAAPEPSPTAAPELSPTSVPTLQLPSAMPGGATAPMPAASSSSGSFGRLRHQAHHGGSVSVVRPLRDRRRRGAA